MMCFTTIPTLFVYFFYDHIPTFFYIFSEMFFYYCIVMLNWFVGQEVSERATRGGDLIEEDEVECRPEKIPTKCLDDNVCIGQISLLMLGTYLKLQWIPCILEVVGLALCVTQICIPVRAFAVMVALIGSI